jgi:hypothetical protein
MRTNGPLYISYDLTVAPATTVTLGNNVVSARYPDKENNRVVFLAGRLVAPRTCRTHDDVLVGAQVVQRLGRSAIAVSPSRSRAPVTPSEGAIALSPSPPRLEASRCQDSSVNASR